MDETLKWTISHFTAYTNASKEHAYNIRHAFGREGHGKGLGTGYSVTYTVYGFEYDCYLGAYGCATKLKAIPADGQHHGCPFKHSKKLNGQLSHWGVKKEV